MDARTIVSNVPALSQFLGVDGRTIVSIIESAGGYRFVEERELWEAAPSGTSGGYWYWCEVQQSGIYASYADALVAAQATISWMPGDSRPF